MFGMCLGGARRVEITLGAAWELLDCTATSSLSSASFCSFHFIDSPLGLRFSSPRPPPRPVVAVAWSRPSLACWWWLEREQYREEQRSRSSLLPFSFCTASSPREHRSRSVLAMLTGRCSLLHRELHRELGLVSVELALDAAAGSSSSRGSWSREERAVHGETGFYLFFCFILYPKRRRFGPKLWSKTASFNLSPSCHQNAPFH
ncbi:hypothetical protein ACOSQ2_010452 [Xanthoceras sorbifolium]